MVFKILGQHNFGWIVGSSCTCDQAGWGASLSLSDIFASVVVVNLRPKRFWWPHQKRHTIVLVLWDLHSVTLPKWLSKYDPTRYIKCILVVSLCHCIWSGVFQVFQTISWTTELFKSFSWAYEIEKFLKSVDLKLRETPCLILLPLKVSKKIVLLLIVNTFKALREKLESFGKF